MKKSELRTLDIVVYRNNQERTVYLNTVDGDKLFKGNVVYNSLTTFSDDLKDVSGDKDLDIIKVKRLTNQISLNSGYDVIWTREEVKKMTVSEIQDELGYKIEIIE